MPRLLEEEEAQNDWDDWDVIIWVATAVAVITAISILLNLF